MCLDVKEDLSFVEGGDFRVFIVIFGGFEISKEGFFYERGRSESMFFVFVCVVFGFIRIEFLGCFLE